MNPTLAINITDGDGTLLCRHEVDLQEICGLVDKIGLKQGELRAAKAVLDASSEVGALVTDEIIAAVARYRAGEK